MKKKTGAVLLCLLISVVLTGCAGNAKAAVPGSSEQTESAANNGTSNADTEETGSLTSAGAAVDVDLTRLSSIMVYSEVYNMVTSPDDYMGKTVKMKGLYYASYYDETDQYYHYIIIEDATECCQQGLEFIWSGTHNYPEDYPEDGTEVEVNGVFGSYEELGITYYYIAVEDIIIL